MRLIKSLFFICILLSIIMGVIKYIIPHPPLLNRISFSQVIYDDRHHLLRLTLTNDQKYRVYTPLKNIAPVMIQATLLQEDQYYYWHPGINPFALFRAAWDTYIKRSRQIGASTITMQVARLYYKINSKTLPGKILQIGRAVELEILYSKNQILEAYLNLAPYGDNIEGVGAASLIYLNKDPGHILLPDAMTLSVIPQNPMQRLPTLNHNAALQTARLKLFARWLQLHPSDKFQKMFMILPTAPVPSHPPFLAPHFVNTILLSNTNQHTINTTLNLHLQNIIDKTTQNYLTHNQQYGIENAAVLLVDTRNMQVKALLGSANFFDKTIEGQVDGTAAKRSPGSTLKPFIYALALDQGLIHPDTILRDAPTHFGAYDPEDFDNDFMGPIKAKDALILSRNVPAIALANQLHNPNFYQFLYYAHIAQLKPQTDYGLSLVLGSAGVTMRELISLYAMLANQGVWQSLHFQTNDLSLSSERLLSPEAAYLTLDMIKDTPRPNPVSNFALNQLPVYWKTGTSSGYRDAWSVGIFGPYALAVWIGDFKGHSNPAYIGTTAAAPLFFAIIDAINKQVGPLPSILPDPHRLHLTRVQVCAASGMLPNHYCPNLISTWFIPGKSPITTDTVYRQIPIDSKTGLRACHYDENTQWKVYEFWPSDLLKIFAEAGIQRQVPPAFEPGCNVSQFSDGTPPKIISPQSGLIYSERLSDTHNRIILFNASGDADVTKLYWFVNNNYLGTTNPNQYTSWQAKAGKYTIRVIDDHGRTDTQDLVVENAQ